MSRQQDTVGDRRREPDRTPIDCGPLLDFAAAVYEASGMPKADARLAADTLVQADL